MPNNEAAIKNTLAILSPVKIKNIEDKDKPISMANMPRDNLAAFKLISVILIPINIDITTGANITIHFNEVPNSKVIKVVDEAAAMATKPVMARANAIYLYIATR